jgi:uncharacterized membrane protein
MKSFWNFIKQNTLRGLFALLPVVISAFVLVQLVIGVADFAADIIGDIAGVPPDSVPFPIFISIGIVLLFSFGLGIIASRTFVSRKIGPWIHRSFIRKIPGYTVMKTIVDGFSGAEINSRIQPALVASHDGAQLLAYLVEDHGNGKVTVFLPKSPSAATGTVAIFPKELVTPLDVKLSEAVTALNQWGVGTRALLEKGLNTEKQI